MSLHKSKGLSSKVVIITSCIEGLLPTISRDATPLKTEREIKENRRLFYVAITRTREILTISSFRNIERSLAFNIGARVVGWSTRTIASRYLNELGPDAPRAVNGTNYINDLTQVST